jgi:UDP-N-acetylglucosamine--N-acetylmuramyl-(pentapeptide) pyrophosphoryl-undecaprenol N-acetylglucosamine transferase
MNRQSGSLTYRFIIAGGGTGGHIFPALAIANKLKALLPDATFLFVGAKGKMEMEKVPQAGFEIQGLTIAGFNRSSLLKNIGLPFKLIQSFIQVSRIIKKFKPDAVIGVGGYSSFPVLRMAQSKGIPTFIHEANSFAGKSNMLLGKKAVRIYTATDGMEKFFPKANIVISGNPVRTSIINSNTTQAEAIQFFGLQPGVKTVLSVGGSLGAQTINEAICKDKHLLLANGLQLIWQTGKSYAEKAKTCIAAGEGVYVNDFISDMEKAYAAADIVISRSGAMSVSELCIVGKPVIFVPYPYAAEDHQTVNAQKLVTKNAALMIKDQDAASSLIAAVNDLAANHEKQALLKKNIQSLAITNADEIVARDIIAYLDQK